MLVRGLSGEIDDTVCLILTPSATWDPFFRGDTHSSAVPFNCGEAVVSVCDCFVVVRGSLLLVAGKEYGDRLNGFDPRACWFPTTSEIRGNNAPATSAI
mmetsp:Transcript_10655/g.21319  ORF Transcript_10655/g.21319 Transcript_10655/m.21319 type:complete len:99 (-) Transcript_10655:58-354(-)